jgi:rod shape-determining protein MreC
MQRVRTAGLFFVGVLALLVGLVVVLVKIGFFTMARGAVLRVSTVTYEAATSVHRFFRNLMGVDYGYCVAERDAFARDAAELQALRSENKALIAALDYREDQQVRMVSARVVSSVQEGTARLLVIDRGSESGLVVGEPVVIMDGILIGKIIAVRDGVSEVMLLTDPRSKVSVVLLGEENQEITGVLEGDRGIAPVVSLIPPDMKIILGSHVITAGLDPQIPRGLYVGAVDRAEKDEGSAFQRALISQPESAKYPIFVLVRDRE